MHDVPESIKIKILEDAGIEPTDLAFKYLKLLAFVKDLTSYEFFDYPPVEQARELLEEIGENEPA